MFPLGAEMREDVAEAGTPFVPPLVAPLGFEVVDVAEAGMPGLVVVPV